MTILETLITIAIVSILLAIAVPQLRSPEARVAASAAHSFQQQMRFEAIKLNRPVVVSANRAGTGLEATSLTNSSHLDCAAAGSPAGSLDFRDYGRVTLTDHDGPFIWLPNGEPRSCSGLPLGAPLDLHLADGRREHSVSVSPAGSVTVR